MFRLTREELNRSQFVTGTQKHRDPRYPPYAFAEHGVAMLSSVLGSDHAVQMNILIIRAFVKLRELLANHKDLARKMERLEANQRQHTSIITSVIEEIRKLKQAPALKPKRRIGFTAE